MTDMAEKPTCGHCGAGPGNQEPSVEYLAAGRKLYFWRCALCGDRTYIDPPLVMTRPVKKAKHYIPGKHLRTATCTVVGCDGKYSPANSKRKMCPRHSQQMATWINNGMKNPPPYLQQGDVWIPNPEYKPNKKRRAA